MLRHYFGIRHLAYRHYLAPFSFQKVRDRQGRNRQVAAATAPLSVLFVFIRVHLWLERKPQHFDGSGDFDVLVANDEVQGARCTRTRWRAWGRRWTCGPLP